MHPALRLLDQIGQQRRFRLQPRIILLVVGEPAFLQHNPPRLPAAFACFEMQPACLQGRRLHR